MTRRLWIERSVLVLAVVASIATSPKRWRVQATLPADDPSKARKLVVETAVSSSDVLVTIANGGTRQQLRLAGPQSGSTWTFLVPAGWQLAEVVLEGRCKTGLCAGECKEPEASAISIKSLAPIATWKLEHRSEPMTTNLRSGYTGPSYTAAVTTSGQGMYRVESSGPAPTVNMWGDAVHVDWGTQSADTSVTWTLVASLEGACVDATATTCQPPADAKLVVGTLETTPP